MRKIINFFTKLGMNDKDIHALINIIIVVFFSFWNIGIGVFFALGLSIGKEVGDYFNPTSNGYFGDLIADFIGILIGLSLVLFIRSVACF